MTFNPSDHLMKLQKKDYLEVKWRLVWFRETFPNGSIETEIVHLDLDRETQEEITRWENGKPVKSINKANGFIIFRATVKDGQGGIATGTKSEKAASFPDFIEKCESGAIGRALAALGFGTQFTGDELAEHHRIVDSPVERADAAQPSHGLTLEAVVKFCDEVMGQGKFPSVRAYVLPPEEVGDLPDALLSQAQLARIMTKLRESQAAKAKKASSGGGR